MRAHEHSKGIRRHSVRKRRGHRVIWESTDFSIFIHFLFSSISTHCRYFFPYLLTWLVYTDVFFPLHLSYRHNLGKLWKRKRTALSKCRQFPGFCFGCLNFRDTNLDRDSLFAMPGRWNLLILGESHLSSICAVVRMENHLLRKFENALCFKEGNWLAAVGWKLLRIDIYILF